MSNDPGDECTCRQCKPHSIFCRCALCCHRIVEEGFGRTDDGFHMLYLSEWAPNDPEPPNDECGCDSCRRDRALEGKQ